jgi:hypothetical protein
MTIGLGGYTAGPGMIYRSAGQLKILRYLHVELVMKTVCFTIFLTFFTVWACRGEHNCWLKTQYHVYDLYADV